MLFRSIKPEEIFVFYDDFSIPLGEYRIRMSGSSGGHNGLGSIISRLHSDKFARMKLGIGPLPEFVKTPDFVLSAFRREDKKKIESVSLKALALFDEIAESGIEKAVSKISSLK